MTPEEALDRVGLSPGSTTSPRSCPGASSSASRSRVRSPSVPTCCCATSRPVRSTIATGKIVLEVIARINAELGTTTIVITHNAAIAGMADRVLRLADGRLVADEANPQKRTPAELSW